MSFQARNCQEQNSALFHYEDARESIACNCWFTSKGTIIPRFFKYEDPENGIIRIPVTEILYTEDKFPSGNHCRIFHCNTVSEGVIYHYQLLFYLKKAEWKVMWM